MPPPVLPGSLLAHCSPPHISGELVLSHAQPVRSLGTTQGVILTQCLSCAGHIQYAFPLGLPFRYSGPECEGGRKTV